MVEIPMLAFVIPVNQVSAYAVALFCGAMLFVHCCRPWLLVCTLNRFNSLAEFSLRNLTTCNGRAR